MWNERKDDEKCFVLVGSVTLAIQAQKYLRENGVYAQIVKADSISPKYGCAYALEYSCRGEDDVKRILRRAGIHAKGVHKIP